MDSALAMGFGARRAPWRIAPGTSADRSNDLTFYRGPTEAWTVRFERNWGAWRIAWIERAPRPVE